MKKRPAKKEDYICPVCNQRLSALGISGHLRFGHHVAVEKARELMLSAKRMPISDDTLSSVQAEIRLPPSIVEPIAVHEPQPEPPEPPEPQIAKKKSAIDAPPMPKPNKVEQKPVKKKQSQPKINSAEIIDTKEDNEMDAQEVTAIVTKVLADDRAAAQARADEEKRKQDVRVRGQERSNNFYKTLDNITETVANLSRGIEQVKDGVVQEVSGIVSPKIDGLAEKQQLLQEEFVTLKASLPEDYCTTFPDLCQKVGEIEKILLPKKLSAEQLTAADVEHAFNCPTCRQAFIDEAKKHTNDIIGDDIDLLKKLAEERSLSLVDKKKKSILDF